MSTSEAHNGQLDRDVELGELKGIEGPGLQAPPDRLYSLYVNEAEKYDNALAARLKTSSDSLLIYAGLFSATVTALLIESYTALIEEPGDTSVFYLIQISQQLAAIQDPARSNVTSQIMSPPAFEPPRSAVRVNTLWVLSLIVSLACALGATLVQTWTNRYTRLVGKFANVAHRAQQREFYFEGIRESRLIIVADALPALLHIALFLFLAGLVEFFFQINIDVAHATLGAVVAVSSAYVMLTVIPLVRTSSPYQTPFTFRIPAKLVHLFQGWRYQYQARFHPQRISQYAKDVDLEFVLRQSRALQWLLDQMTGVYSFDRFVEGIEPFLRVMDHSSRIVFQLNVRTNEDQRRRSLAAHIGFRLQSCLDTSLHLASRRSQVKSITGALWALLARLQIGDMEDDIAPGGTHDRSQWYPVARHLQQWLHPYTLRALRRLRYDPDPLISLYANCTSALILRHVIRTFCDQLQDGDEILVPRGWGFLQFLSACDVPSASPNMQTSYEFDVLTTCLLAPPADKSGHKSRAEEDLSGYELTLRQHPTRYSQSITYQEKDLVALSKDHILNTCHLEILNIILEQLLSRTSELRPTPSIIDMVHQTVKILAVNANAGETEESTQRTFVALLERLFHRRESHLLAPRILSGQSTFLLQEFCKLVAPLSQTLDHPVWARKAYQIVYGVEWYANAEELVLSDVQSGRLGRVAFDSLPIRSGAKYFVCCGERNNVLDLSGTDDKSILIFGLHGGENQKWKLLYDDQYWTLQSLATGTFLDVNGPATDNATLVASTQATRWDIQRDVSDLMRYNIFYAGTRYGIARGSGGDARMPVLSQTDAKILWEFGRIIFNPMVKPGVKYFLRCGNTSNTLDLSGSDCRSILIFQLHGGNNQKWQFIQDGDYWTLRNVATGTFLDVDGPAIEGAGVIASYVPTKWELRPDETNPMDYNIFYGGTEYGLTAATRSSNEAVILSQTQTSLISWKLLENDDLLAKSAASNPQILEQQPNNIKLGVISLKSGARYLLYCQNTNNSLDLSGADNKSILIWDFHGGGNQRWLLTQDGEYWTFQSIATGQYLSVDGPVTDNAPVIVSDLATQWEIKPDRIPSTYYQHGGPIYDAVGTSSGVRYIIRLAGSQYSLALQNTEQGAAVTLSGANQASIRWRIETIQ